MINCNKKERAGINVGNALSRTSAEWLEIIRRQQASGKQAQAWCEEKGIKYRSMVDASNRLRKQGMLETTPKRRGEYAPSRTSEEWLELIKQQRSSGKKIGTWCEEKGINYHTMAESIRRFKRRGLFIEQDVVIPPEGKPSTSSPKEKSQSEPVAANRWVEVTRAADISGGSKQIGECEIRVEIGKFSITLGSEFSADSFTRVCEVLMNLC